MQTLKANQLLTKRRDFLRGSMSVLFFPYALLSVGQSPSTSSEAFNKYIEEFQHDGTLANGIRYDSETAEWNAEFVGLEHGPIRTPKSNTPISERATNLIIYSEVTNKSYYTAHYKSPVWPGKGSGVTIGIGYDLGWTTVNNLSEDWDGYLDTKDINLLSAACGIKGSAAAALVTKLKPITIPWERAVAQFNKESLPRYVGQAESSLKNTARLSQDSLGALVSLIYNRGPSFSVQKPRYEEMRSIARDMASSEFVHIPLHLRSMERLWKDVPEMRGLVVRREAEACLFEIGLMG